MAEKLQQNQIRELLIWVHPGYLPVSDGVLNAWKDIIEILEYEPRVALVETSMVDNPDAPDNGDYWNCRIPWGEYGNKRSTMNGKSV